VLTPDELGEAASRLAPGAVAVGDGAIHFRAVLEAVGVTVPADDSALHRVSAREHCRLAAAGPAGTPDTVLPAYLRLADAELKRPA
jgi:tRNA threonylcarbamoyladenosine biosynthesis protein TsaB